MFSQKIRHILHTMVLYTLLTINQPIHPMFSEKLDLPSYHAYIITCITSCCIGAILYALIQKYCCNKPTILSQQFPKETAPHQKKFEELHTTMNNIQTDINSIKEKYQELIELNTKNNKELSQIWYQHISAITTNIQLLQKKKQELQQRTPLLTTPMFISLFWHYKYNESAQALTQKTKECEEYKKIKTTQSQIDQSAQL